MNRDLKRAILDKLVAAVVKQGFANVSGRLEESGLRRTTKFIVTGECPCGLGVSTFSQYVTDREYVSSRVADNMAMQMGAVARKHIELDKAEGRWA